MISLKAVIKMSIENTIAIKEAFIMEDFKMNVFFHQDGEEIEKLLANYLISKLNSKEKIQ